MIALNITLALFMWAEANAFKDKQGIFLDSPALWAFIALVTGLLGVFFYWLVHYSTLRRTNHH